MTRTVTAFASALLLVACGDDSGGTGTDGAAETDGTDGAAADTDNDPSAGTDGPVDSGGSGGTAGSGPDSGPDSGETGDTDDSGGEEPFVPSTHFGDASTWSVPEGGWGGVGFAVLGGQAYDPGDDAWTTFDITGDGIPDLVVTAAHGNDGVRIFGHGNDPHWNVYEGGADGFASTPTAWSVPDGGWSSSGFSVTGGAAYDPGDDAWTTLDITGDGIPDLVVTARHGEGGVEVLGNGGTPHWNVYEGGASGFAASPTAWAVPDGGWDGFGFVVPSGSAYDPGDDAWSTLDVTGDGVLDLLVTARHGEGDVEVLGNGSDPHWNVYEGGASGFAASPSAWSVPEGGWDGYGFVVPGGSAYDPGDDAWSTLDITGDGVPDLLVTARHGEGGVEVLGNGSDPHWNVYVGGASGFAASATTWSVPEGGWDGYGFVVPAGTAYDPGDDGWSTLDLDGDGRLDLVVTGHNEGSLEVLGLDDGPHWRAYLGAP